MFTREVAEVSVVGKNFEIDEVKESKELLQVILIWHS